jgi:hypothetical protein
MWTAAQRAMNRRDAGGFPSWSTKVYNTFRKFERDGVWEATWVELHAAGPVWNLALPTSRQPRGFSWSAGQIEYCSS